MAAHLRRLLPSIVGLVVLLPGRATACSICFAGVDSPLLDSARLGVLTMAVLTVAVLGTFGAWFVRLARLEAQVSDADRRPDRQAGQP